MSAFPRSRSAAALAFAAAVLAAADAPAAAFDARPYARARDLEPPAARAHPVAAVAFDDDLFRHAGPGFADVRVADDRGAEVPSLPRCRVALETRVDEVAVGLPVVALDRGPDGRLDLVVEKPGGVPELVFAIELDTPLKDFEKRVEVEASNDRAEWTPVADGAAIYDYTRHVALRQTRVGIRPGPFRFYRLRISAANDEQLSPLRTILRDRRGGEVVGEQERLTLTRVEFRVDRVRGLVRRTSEGVERPVRERRRLAGPKVAADEVTGDTLVRFDLPGVPLVRLEIESPDANFVRPVRLEGAAEEGDGWTTVAEGTLVSVEVGAARRRELGLEVSPARRFARYRLRIRNGDSPPIAVAALVAETETWDLLFFHAAGRGYRMYYGRPGAAPPDYDIGRVLGSTRLDGADSYRPGPPGPNPAFDPSPRAPRWSGKTALVVAVLAAAALLVAIIARVARAVERTPDR